MKLKTNDLIFLLGLALPAVLVFRALLSTGPAVWGDAPYFYQEELRELVAEPFVWTNWGNNFGGINQVLWISPLMFLYGLLHVIFGLSNDVIIRAIFYFPAILLVFLSPLVLTRGLGCSKIVQFFTSLLYGLNTYFLLLIDGGQVGIALAYGIFPLTVHFLRKIQTNFTTGNFLLACIITVFLMVADPRFVFMAVLTVLAWGLFEWLVSGTITYLWRLGFLIPVLVVTVAVGLYWIIPMLFLEKTQVFANGGSQFLSLLNSLFLFQPHWPANEFGKVSSPLFYFVGIPLLVFGSLFFHRDRKILIFTSCFLFFAFLSKGETPPFGDWYTWMTINLPFGVAFRDSSKFFTPLLLFSGILIGITVEYILRLSRGRQNVLLLGLLWLYFLFLIYPALFSQLNGVLAARTFDENFTKVSRHLMGDDSFFRSTWFIEHHPLGFYTEEKPTLDAKSIVDIRPFAQLNVGTTDRFNFLHNPQFLDWFDLFGIKYLVFSGNPRKLRLNEEEQKDWQNLLELVDGIKDIQKVDWGTDFSIYQLPNVKPRIFAVEKLLAVVGGDSVYEKLHVKNPNFSAGNQGLVFFEDGKFDPRDLDRVSSNSAVLVFNQKEKRDLLFSFLSKSFVSPTENKQSQWAIRTTDDYLKWKFELLVNKIGTTEFDYGKGIAFSSQPNEKVVFTLEADKDGEYLLAIRHMSLPAGSPLRMVFNNQTEEISITRLGQFEWYTQEIRLARGKYDLVLENPDGLQVLNVVGLIPKEDWENANKLADEMFVKFPVTSLEDISSLGVWQKVDYEMVSPVEYAVIVPPEVNWLVFSDTYNAKWVFKKGEDFQQSYPFYSAINGFNVSGVQEGKILFNGQRYVRLGLYLSLGTLVLLATLFVWAYSRSRSK